MCTSEKATRSVPGSMPSAASASIERSVTVAPRCSATRSGNSSDANSFSATRTRARSGRLAATVPAPTDAAGSRLTFAVPTPTRSPISRRASSATTSQSSTQRAVPSSHESSAARMAAVVASGARPYVAVSR